MFFSEPSQNIATFGMICLSMFFWRCSPQGITCSLEETHRSGAPYRIALYVASPSYESLFRWRGRFRLRRVDPLEERRRPRRVWPNRSTWTPHHALRLVPRGTQISYSAAVDLVAELGVSQIML
ncbi:hypothetical protein M9H77_06455 [Catharanthus roseus]|uniref:Uncharacterized protein n=1 Tax=Catharanthus roseus TaxID=4058 RepID=A0ACC0BS54_CATRO|nr:hypothetical protein M9H77_06455 [Catharanthus roseus]